MEQRGVNLLQLKMFLLILRMSALPLLLSLLLVSMATAEQGLTCQQEIPTGLIRDLWSHTKQLIDNLPKDNSNRRLLPHFCINCSKHVIGWLEIRELINVYQKSVFSKGVVKKLLPLHYDVLLARLQDTLQHCVSSSKPSKWFHSIERLKKKIQKMGDKGAIKAVTEFTFIFTWIDELAHNNIL